MGDIIAELDGLTLSDVLRRSSKLYDDREFIKTDYAVWNFAEFDSATDRLASGLLALGVGPGDRVAAWVNNSAEWAFTLCASARIGAVTVPINTRYTPTEAHFLLAHSEAKVLVLSRRNWGKDFLEMLGQVAPGVVELAAEELSLPELPALRRLIFVGDEAPERTVRFAELLRTPVSADLKDIEDEVRPDSPLLICYTSGTTGRPKGAVHNHRVIKQAARVGLALQMKPGSRVLGHMPLYHVAGLYMGLLPALTFGACFLVMEQWDTAAALQLIERERITTLGGIPTHFADMADHPDVERRDLSSFNTAWIGGATLAEATYERYLHKLGLKHLLSTYGMTENTISTTFNKITDPPSVCCMNTAPILGDCEVRVVDPATGDSRSTGEVGEIWCRGETVMMGYYKDPEATRLAITEDGWLRTGDLGRFNEEGYLNVTGRLKDMYKSGGTNVYPAEIESFLVRHSGVRQVSVVGVPDERLGEVGFAFIESQPGADVSEQELRAYCRGALASYKIPHYFLVLPEMPRTSTGKIAKSELAVLATRRLATAP